MSALVRASTRREVCIIFIYLCSFFEALALVYRVTTHCTNARSLSLASRILGQTAEMRFLVGQARRASEQQRLVRPTGCWGEYIEWLTWYRRCVSTSATYMHTTYAQVSLPSFLLTISKFSSRSAPWRSTRSYPRFSTPNISTPQPTQLLSSHT